MFLCASDRDLGLPLKIQLGSQASSSLETRTLLSSRVVKWGSGPLSCTGEEFGLFQEDKQGCQASHHLLRGYSVFPWSQHRGIRTYLEMRGNLCFQLILRFTVETVQGNQEVSGAEGELGLLFTCSGIREVTFRFNR